MIRPGVVAVFYITMASLALGQDAVPLPEGSSYVAQGASSSVVEPAMLPGNVPEQANVAFVEPSLPQNGEPTRETPAETPQENSPMPRRFRYALSLELRGVYDDNVTLARDSGNRRSDFSSQISSGIVLGLGDVIGRDENFVALTYTPSAYFYLENSEFNTFEHIGEVEGQWHLGRITLTLTQNLASVQSTNLGVLDADGGFNNQTNLDVGGRRRITTYSTRLFASAALTGKTSLRLGASYSISDPEDRIGSDTLSGTLGIDYRYGPKLRLGSNLVAGNRFVEGSSPDQTFEQLNVRADYELTGKLSIDGSAGIEFRQSESDAQNRSSPVFRLGVNYKPFDGADLSLSTSRRTQNSASAVAQDFVSTQVVFFLRQRFLQRIHATLVTGYQNQTYYTTRSGLASTRDDNYFFVVPGIDVTLTQFWSAGLFYSSRRNDSSSSFFSFNDNQVGFRSNFTF